MRQETVQKLLITENLKALIFIGDTNVGPDFCGDFRYYVNNRIIFYRQVVLVLSDSTSVLLAGSEIQRQAAAGRSFINDCRLSNNLVADAVRILKDRKISSGRVGVNFEMLPTAWYMYMKQELPEIDFVETHESIMKIRFQQQCIEDFDTYQKGASLGDGGFEAALKIIRPGISEYEIVAEIEHYARTGGAEEHFTLIGSGKFAFGDGNTMPLPYSPSERLIEAGDSITIEITPRYDSTWTQLVRTVNVSQPNADIQQIHKICLKAIEKALEKLKPGETIKDLVLAMESYVSSCGFLLKPPLGHICGIDLIEARVSSNNEMIIKPGTAVIIHPTIFTPDGKNSFFWGETYFVTSDGYKCLHRTGNDLLTI
jgi:methionine aminopeptidase